MSLKLIINDAQIKKMQAYYREIQESIHDDRILYSFKNDEIKIIIYKTKTVLFQGKNALETYEMWAKVFGKDIMKKPDTSTYVNSYQNKRIIGSDEVGTGDFFGPVVVAAAYVTPKDESLMEQLNIQDSKNLTDDQIITIGKTLIETIPYHILVLPPEKFNQLTYDGYNMNKVKAYLHNHALKKMVQKCPSYDYVIVDQFCSEERYYDYLKGETVVKNIRFHTKGETVHKAVACASIIARYKFLLEMDALSKTVSITLPKGAGPSVDAIGKLLKLKYDTEIFSKIAKINFKNYHRIVKE